VTPSGIEPATFRLVAQSLNKLRHRVPLRGIVGPVYDNEKENRRILTDKEIYARVKILL